MNIFKICKQFMFPISFYTKTLIFILYIKKYEKVYSHVIIKNHFYLKNKFTFNFHFLPYIIYYVIG